MIRLQPEDPDQPEIVALLRDAARHSAELYPAESNHHLSPAAFCRSNVAFFVARDAAGSAIATGALVANGDWAEIKAMWVVPQRRGEGLSRLVLAALEAHAKQQGLRALLLETGVVSQSALSLYNRFGFVRCAPFGDYQPDPLSVFMEKVL